MYNTMRITGLASGIDTEEMIQSLMKAERVKVDRVEQDKQILLWRQEMYNDLNKDFANFIINSRKDLGLTSITYDGTFRPNSYQNLNWVKKATSSNESKATVSTTAKAMDGNYKVNVKQLAEGVSMASGSDIRKDIDDKSAIVNEDGTLIMQEFKFNISDGKNSVTISSNDIKDKKADGKAITMNDVVKAINSAKFEEGTGENKKEIPLGVRASYDANIGRFFLQTTNTGKDAKIQITTVDDEAGINGKDFIDALNLQYRAEEKDADGNITYKYKEYTVTNDVNNFVAGQDAIINFNGANNIESSSNRITINGITMDLKDTGDFNVNVSTDVDGIYEKIEKFVNDYNELVDKTNKLLGEKQYRDYKPLTAEQKKAMEKEDINLWEEKAKSGLLKSDDIIYRTMLNTRQSIYKEFGDEFKFKLITEIGISTEQYSRGSAGGRLAIDEQKLKDAIAKDPEGVMELLFKESTVTEVENASGKKVKRPEGGGFVTRIHDNLMLGMEEIIKKSGTGSNADLYRGVKGSILLDFVSQHSSISLLDKDVLQFNKKIDDLNTMLFRKENHYYAKFAAMEKAISRMNQQSSWLTQQMMG